jgi:hypothetical protein
MRSCLFAFAIVLSACATPHVLRPGDLAPLTASVPTDQREVMWQRAIGALLDEGYVPQVLNEAACYISAKQRDDLVDDKLAGTIVLVTITPEGTLRVEVGGSGLYSSDDAFLADVQQLQAHLLSAILARSATRTPAMTAPITPTETNGGT